ncbi:hypothetical protein ACVMYR_28280 [Micromonospora sp. PTRAS2]
MGYELRREVRAHLPQGLLTPLERLLVLEIADQCWDGTRECYPGAGLLAALIDRPERTVEETLKSIAKKWIELRVPLGTDKHGRVFYAHRKARTTFRVPPAATLRARYEEIAGHPWETSLVASLPGASGRKPPGKTGASDEKAPGKSGAFEEQKAPETSGASGPKAPEKDGGITPESPRESRGPTTNPPPPTSSPTTTREAEEAEAAPETESVDTAAVRLVDTQRGNLTIPDARELTRSVTAAFRRGWPAEAIADVLDRPLTGLDDPGRGLIGRVRKLGAPPAPHEMVPTSTRKPARASSTFEPYRNAADEDYLNWVNGPHHEEPAA